MNVLQIADSFTRGGLEHFIVDVSEGMSELGCICFYAFGSYAPSTESLSGSVVSDGFCFASGARVSIGGFLEDIEKLCNIISEHSIDAILAHPFRCLYPATIAAHLSGIPIGYVVHGSISLTFPESLSEYLLFRSCIAHSANAVFTVNRSAVTQLGPISGRLVELSQPISIRCCHPTGTSPEGKVWALASRLDSDKVEGIARFLDMLPNLDISKLLIYGDGNCLSDLSARIEELGFSELVSFEGHREDWLFTADGRFGVIGLGRVALEALACGYPVVLLSPYDNPCGVMNATLYNTASYANFNGSNLQKVNTASELDAQLAEVYANPRRFDLSEVVVKKHSSVTTARDIIEALSTAQGVALPHWGKVLELLADADSEELLFGSRALSYALLWHVSSFYPDGQLKANSLADTRFLEFREADRKTHLKLEGQIDSLVSSSSVAANRLSALEQQSEKLNWETCELKNGVNSLETHVTDSEGQLKRKLEETMQRLFELEQHLETESSRLQEHIDEELKSAEKRHQAELQKIRESNSWRIGRAVTAVPRAIKRQYGWDHNQHSANSKAKKDQQDTK